MEQSDPDSGDPGSIRVPRHHTVALPVASTPSGEDSEDGASSSHPVAKIKSC
jgi:hypothetical protein